VVDNDDDSLVEMDVRELAVYVSLTTTTRVVALRIWRRMECQSD